MLKQINSLNQFKALLNKDADFADNFKQDPVPVVQQIVIREMANAEHRLRRLLVVILSTIVIIALMGMVGAWYVKNSRTAPDFLIAIACFALGMLAGIFTGQVDKEKKNEPPPTQDV
jgi:hypothetical protein